MDAPTVIPAKAGIHAALTASRSIDQTGTRSRAIERTLRSVEELPSGDDATALLGLATADLAGEEEESAEQPT